VVNVEVDADFAVCGDVEVDDRAMIVICDCG